MHFIILFFSFFTLFFASSDFIAAIPTKAPEAVQQLSQDIPLAPTSGNDVLPGSQAGTPDFSEFLGLLPQPLREGADYLFSANGAPIFNAMMNLYQVTNQAIKDSPDANEKLQYWLHQLAPLQKQLKMMVASPQAEGEPTSNTPLN